MDTTISSLDDYLERSIAGFKQGQTFYETARSYLETKERLSVKEFFLLRAFKQRPEELIKSMKKATGAEDLLEQVIRYDYLDNELTLDYKKLMILEEKLKEAKERNDTVDVIITCCYGGPDLIYSATTTYVTSYLRIIVEDWSFKETALHIIPKKPYQYRKERYVDDEFSSIEDSGIIHRWDIEVKDPIYERVEIIHSSCTNGSERK